MDLNILDNLFKCLLVMFYCCSIKNDSLVHDYLILSAFLIWWILITVWCSNSYSGVLFVHMMLWLFRLQMFFLHIMMLSLWLFWLVCALIVHYNGLSFPNNALTIENDAPSITTQRSKHQLQRRSNYELYCKLKCHTLDNM